MTENAKLPALGRIPSGLFILTVSNGQHETGMLVSWVQQAGMDPPAISVAVRHGRYVEDWLSTGRPFAISILAEEQKDMLRHFSRGFEIGEPAFEGLEVLRTELGLPVLANCVGYVECQSMGHVDVSDHRIFVARVSSDRLLGESRPFVHLRRSGTQY